MELFSYLLGKKSGGGGGGTGPKIEAKNPLNASGGFQTNITKIGDFTFNGTSCQAMFTGYTSLTDVDFSNFTTTNVTSYKYMFNNCSSLTKLDLSSFGTSNITDLSYMFNGCTNLKEIDLSNLNSANTIVTNTYSQNAFTGCNSLEKLDMRNFDFTKLHKGDAGTFPLQAFFNNTTLFATCLVIVKDNTQKQYIIGGNNPCSWMKNVKTVEEYENVSG